MKYALYPGCSMESTARDYKLSTLAVAEALGMNLKEVPNWTCCGSTPVHFASELLATALSARNLAAAEQLGRDVVVCCASCYSRLAMANHAMRENEYLRAEVAGIIGQEYSGGVRVRHFLEVIYRDIGVGEIGAVVINRLEKLKVACYYGCLLTRPKSLSIAEDNEDPDIMEEILRAVGVSPVEWPYKTECCGASFSITRVESAMRLSAGILQMARDSGANCIAVACPLCQSNLDLRQSDIEMMTGESFRLPVLYFTQILGIAFGLPKDKLGLNCLVVEPDNLLAGQTVCKSRAVR